MSKAFTEEQFKQNRNIFTELDDIINEQLKFQEISQTVYYPNEGNVSSERLKLGMEENNKSILTFAMVRQINYSGMEKHGTEINHSNLEDIIRDMKDPNSKLSFEEVRFYHYMYGINTDPNQILSYVYFNHNIRRQNSINQNGLNLLLLQKEIVEELKDFVRNLKVPFSNMVETEFNRVLEIVTNVGNKIRELQKEIDKNDIKPSISEDINS